MDVDWARLAVDAGARDTAVGGDRLARRAAEMLIGADVIDAAVDAVLGGGEGSELALSLLMLLRSERASARAIAIYRSSSGDRASSAAALVARIAAPGAAAVVEALLADDDTAGWGVDLLERLIVRQGIDDDDAARLGEIVRRHPSERIRAEIARIESAFDRRWWS